MVPSIFNPCVIRTREFTVTENKSGRLPTEEESRKQGRHIGVPPGTAKHLRRATGRVVTRVKVTVTSPKVPVCEREEGFSRLVGVSEPLFPSTSTNRPLQPAQESHTENGPVKKCTRNPCVIKTDRGEGESRERGLFYLFLVLFRTRDPVSELPSYPSQRRHET